MKKTIKNIATLILFTSISILISCSNEDEALEVNTYEREATVTINFPNLKSETRVGIDDTTLKLTGWELNDEVILIKSFANPPEYSYVQSTFKCIDASTGLFSGVLPAGVSSVSDMDFALYNAYTIATGPDPIAYFYPKKWGSENLKDVVMMAAVKDGNNEFNMKLIGSALALTNNSSTSYTANTKCYGYSSFSVGCRYRIMFDSLPIHIGSIFNVGGGHNYTLPNGGKTTYLYLPVDPDIQCAVYTTENVPLTSYKNIPEHGKLYHHTIN